MRDFKETNIPGVFEVELFHAADERGTFIKNLHRTTLEKHGLNGRFDEGFYSVNKKGAIRGMHFQHPPYDHSKIVYCTSGRLLDVILDIREGSPTYGKTAVIELSATNFRAAYLPSGVAHGFAVLEDHTVMHYLTETMHELQADDGIHFGSFGFEWPVEIPVVSERDQSFQAFASFQTPFVFHG